MASKLLAMVHALVGPAAWPSGGEPKRWLIAGGFIAGLAATCLLLLKVGPACCRCWPAACVLRLLDRDLTAVATGPGLAWAWRWAWPLAWPGTVGICWQRGDQALVMWGGSGTLGASQFLWRATAAGRS